MGLITVMRTEDCNT